MTEQERTDLLNIRHRMDADLRSLDIACEAAIVSGDFGNRPADLAHVVYCQRQAVDALDMMLRVEAQ